MANTIGQGVTLRGLWSEDFSYTWTLSGTNGIDPNVNFPASGVSVAMSQDTALDETAKVTSDGSVVLGSLASFENRVQEGIVVGAIRHKGNFLFEYTGTAPVRGNSVLGSATGGKVKDSGAAASGAQPRVLAVYPSKTQVLVMVG